MLVCNRNPSDVEDYLFTLDVTRERTKRSASVPNPRAVKPLTVRHFFLAKVRMKEVVRTTRAVDGQLVSNMASYVPMFILNDLLVKNAVRTDPAIESFFSVIVFIDISGTLLECVEIQHAGGCSLFTGFTALNERLGKLGPAGPELVSKHLNAYFGQLIEAVYQHGGDVLKVRVEYCTSLQDGALVGFSVRYRFTAWDPSIYFS